jgi:hypothetical protein
MKRTQRCLDLTSLEHERSLRDEFKRSRTDSEQTDSSLDSELSDVSERFERVACVTPTSTGDAEGVKLSTIQFHFNFQAQDFSKSSAKVSAGLDRVIHLSLVRDQ